LKRFQNTVMALRTSTRPRSSFHHADRLAALLERRLVSDVIWKSAYSSDMPGFQKNVSGLTITTLCSETPATAALSP
jgi:hypothetical protein